MALRPWSPFTDAEAGVSISESWDSKSFVDYTTDNFVPSWTGKNGTRAASTRDDYRARLGAVNGIQTVYFPSSTTQLPIGDGTKLATGSGDKWWCIVTKVLDTRAGDRYPLGYGGNNGSSVAWKMKQGIVPYSDIGTVGYAIGTETIGTSGISIITERYKSSNTMSSANYNGKPVFSTYSRARNTSLGSPRLGSWSVYGDGTEHQMFYFFSGYGYPSDDWILKLASWCSFNAGDQGGSIHADNIYKGAAPTVDDGTGGGSNAVGNATLPLVQSNASTTVAINGNGSGTLPLVVGSGAGSVENRAVGNANLPMIMGSAQAGVQISGQSSSTLPALQSSAQVSVAVSAQADSTLPALQGSSQGSVQISAVGNSTLPLVYSQGSTSNNITGRGDATLPLLTSEAQGTVPIVAQAGGFTARPISTSEARVLIKAEASSVLPQLTGSSTGTLPIQAQAASALPMVVGSGQGEKQIKAVGDAVLPMLQGSAEGSKVVNGQANSTLPMVVGSSTLEVKAPEYIIVTTPDGRRITFPSTMSRVIEFPPPASRVLELV